MDTLADYESWKAKQQQNGVGAAQAVLSSGDAKPDEVASDLNLGQDFAKATGNPTPPLPMVTQYRNVFQQAIEQQRNSTILSSAPRLTEWLRNPENAAVARDDLQGLSWWETSFKAAGNAVSRGVMRLPQSFNQFVANSAEQTFQDQKRDFGGILGDERSIHMADGSTRPMPGIPSPGDLFNAGYRFSTSRLSSLFGVDQQQAAEYHQQQAGEIAKKIATVPMSPPADAFRQSMMAPVIDANGQPVQQGVWEQLGKFVTDVAHNPGGALAFLSETAVESTPMLAAATAVTAATRSPSAGAVFMGAASGLQEAGTTPVDFLREKGIDVSTPEGAAKAIADPALMAEAAQRGVIRGLIIGAMDGMSGGLAGQKLASSALGNVVLQAFAQAAMGASGEAMGQIASGQKLSVTDIIIEGLAEFVTAPIEVAGVGGEAYLGGLRKAKAAESRQSLFKELSGQSVSSKLRERMPEKFRQFVEAATANGPVEHVYVPAEQFSQYFQSQGIDPNVVVDQLDGVTRDDLAVALAGGGDLQIPTATYASKIAGSEHDKFLMENMRFDPSEFTSAEAKAFNSKAQDAMHEAWTMAEQMRVQDESLRSFEQEIYDTMVTRLRTAGRSTDVATSEAMLYPAFYRVMAERSGMTTEEFMARYPLPQVRGAVPQGMQPRAVDELTRTLAEARQSRTVRDTRPTLLEFIAKRGGIADPTGELSALNAESIKRGKGKKTLNVKSQAPEATQGLFGVQGGGASFDEVAQAAIDAGYLHDSPIVHEWQAATAEGRQVPDLRPALLAAIDAEARGTPQYSAQDVADPALAQQQSLDDVEAYLASIGTSLDAPDEAIRQAIGQDQAGRSFAQVSPDQARAIDMPVELPTDPLFTEAIANTPGAKITDDGLLIDLVRYQKEEQAGSTSVRTGVFYLPTGSASSKHYKGGKNAYGGKVEVRGETLIKRPIFVKGATGGKAPEAAYDEIKGKGAYQKMRSDVFKVISGDKRLIEERGYNLLEEYGADGNMIWEIVPNSTQGNTLLYALQENIVAHAVRDAGYDAVVGYSKGRGGKGVFISEVFDVREIDYPTPGETATLHPQFEGHSYNQPAYHGTPHLFDKFSTDHIGTGEGAQAYGWGLYFTSDKAVATWYRNKLAGKPMVLIDGVPLYKFRFRQGKASDELVALKAKLPKLENVAGLEQRSFDVLSKIDVSIYADLDNVLMEIFNMVHDGSTATAAAEEIKRARTQHQSIIQMHLDTARKVRDDPSLNASYRRIQSERTVELASKLENNAIQASIADALLRSGVKLDAPKSGRIYHVEVPHDEDMLNWDAQLSQQSEKVRLAVEQMGLGEPFATGPAMTDHEFLNKILGPLRRAFAGTSYASMFDGQVVARGMFTGNPADVAPFVELVRKDHPEAAALVERLATQIVEPTGKDIYNRLVEQMTGETPGTLGRDVEADRAASEALRAAGIPGHKYIGHESQKTNYVIYDDSRVSVTSYEQPTGDGPRGMITFPGFGKGDTVIQLFERADLSTMLHETGHYFLTVMQDLAHQGEQQASDDFHVLREWWKGNAAAVAQDGMKVNPNITLTAEDVIASVEAGSTGDLAKDAAIDAGMQEQFARGFEAYLMEGKAPTAELRGAFEKFRAWLISIYQRVVGLNVTITDEVRGVMDRMLASDAEIVKAQTEAGDTGPLFATADDMGLTPEEYAAFGKLYGQAQEDAKAKMLREAMAPIKRAQEKWFKDERAKVRAEVEREVNAYRYYRAIEWMGNRRWMGDGQPADMPDIRLSKDILVERYGEGVLKTLPRGKQTVYTVDGGLDPDDAAGWFGFDSGDQMIRAMEKAPARKEAIDAETDKLMRDRHGDVLTDGSAEAQALDAVHSDKRSQALAAELKALVEVAGTGTGITAKEVRAVARETIGRMRVRDAMNANRFLAAERKAGEEAARLGAMVAREAIWMNNARRRVASKARGVIKGDGTIDAVAAQQDQANASTGNYNETVTKLIEAKRRQLLNHALYAEARAVTDEVEKAERYAAKLGKASTREKIAGAGRRENAVVDYLGAIDEVLVRYDFRKSSGAADDRRGALVAFVEAMKMAGRENELSIPDALLADIGRKPYKTLSVETLRGVIDGLKNLEHVALRWNALIDGQQQRDLEAVVADITAAFDANMPKRPPGRVNSKAEGARNSVRQFFDLVINAGTILREIDGFTDMGAAYRNLKAPIDAAVNRLIVRKEAAATALEKLYDVYSKAERRRMAVRDHMPELGYSLSKWERIAVALNTGNAGNFQRLTDNKVKGALTEAQVTAVLATLDERDAAFIQSVWDYVGSFRADIGAREKRATGVEPQWVEPRPVEVAGKTLRGGYYPLKYDPRLSSLARDDATQDIAQALQAGRFGKAQTRNGHLKERAQSSGRDVELDMSVLHRHVNQVIYDLELSEPVANSWRILQNAQVRQAFIDTGKTADFDALETWLKDVAEGELRSADWMNKASRTLKSNFTAAKLAFNLSTVAMQVTGLSQSMVVVGKKDFTRGVVAAFRPGAPAEIAAKSPYMATRQTTFNKDIYDFYNDPLLGPVATRWGDFKANVIGPLSFWLMTKVQFHLVDVPTWLAGYQQGLRQYNNDEAKAIEHADAVVKRAQASGLFHDRSAIERGSVSRQHRQNDVVRLFTTLASYMFAKFNVAYERSGKAKKVIGQEGLSLRSAQEALSWTIDMSFLFMLEAVVTAAIKGRLPSDDDKKDEGWLRFLAKETGFTVISTVPFLRDIGSIWSGFDSGGAYGGILADVAKGGKGAAGLLSVPFGGELKPSDVKAVINATGLATGMPATQINRAVDATWRQVDGQSVSPLEYLLGKMGK